MNRGQEAPDWVFGLHDCTQGIPRRLADGITSRVFVGENSMLSVVRVEPHSVGAIHKHPEEQWGVLLEGACIRIQGDGEVRVGAGDFWHTPGSVPHGIRTEGQGALILDVFSPPKDEYRTVGAGYGIAETRDA